MKIWAFLGLADEMGANGCSRALGARPPHPRTGPDMTPLPNPNRQNPGKTDVCLGSRGGVGLMYGAIIGLGMCARWGDVVEHG